jgi:hypothetical protein
MFAGSAASATCASPVSPVGALACLVVAGENYDEDLQDESEMNGAGWPKLVVAISNGQRRRAERLEYAFHASNGPLP